MNIVEYKSKKNPIVFCFIDNTHLYKSAWTKELIKNLSDYCISNIFGKKYDIFQSQDEDSVLKKVAEQGYKHAVVFSTGTEFINGVEFFNQIEELVKTDYAIYGHILDRGNAYYELHHQCYLINLQVYKDLGCPEIGQTNLNSQHNQVKPHRSKENIHDNYTPLCIGPGVSDEKYDHKLHGWNIVSSMLDKQYKIYAFDNNIRKNKKHYYPENQTEFLKHISWAYSRYNYCANEFIHYKNTENLNVDKKYNQIITPASGEWFVDYIDTTQKSTVILYDYNQAALDYWKENVPSLDNVSYEFLKVDLLGYNNKSLVVNQEPSTLLNLSNIFCYEGTAMFSSLEYRQQKENELLQLIPKDWDVMFSANSTLGFTENLENTKINNLKKPTWHITDWLY